jgi:hypothetical protein
MRFRFSKNRSHAPAVEPGPPPPVAVQDRPLGASRPERAPAPTARPEPPQPDAEREPAQGAPAKGRRARAGARARGAMRRRLRELGRVREALLLELGAIVYEMHRNRRPDTPLAREKVAELARLEHEARGLAAALERRDRLPDVVFAGIAGSCSRCGAIVSTNARFCSRCGDPVAQGSETDAARPAAREAGSTTVAARSPGAAPPGGAAPPPSTRPDARASSDTRPVTGWPPGSDGAPTGRS